MISSLPCHSDTTLSPSSPLVPIQALSKIPRLKPAQSTSSSSSSSSATAAPIATASTNTVENGLPVFNQTNALHIYQGKNIVFFGDNTIRKIYRDLLRLLHKGKLMHDSELKTRHTYHKLYGIQREMLCLRTGCEAYRETAKHLLSQLYILLRDSNIELKIPIKCKKDCWLIITDIILFNDDLLQIRDFTLSSIDDKIWLICNPSYASKVLLCLIQRCLQVYLSNSIQSFLHLRLQQKIYKFIKTN
ncbi:unnamed protein product [Rotaria sordida]|uniref:Uncharacterized protein n=1 Tax=Rotaria sordida TaxID=392033 RepID=A0A814UQL4_9BILA|nr:unnamed protein product [Rotaria sordida]